MVHHPGGEPHSAHSYRAVGAARIAIFRSGSVISCGSLERVEAQGMPPPVTLSRFRGVAAAVHQKHCSKS
jgi:hypothetical protein